MGGVGRGRRVDGGVGDAGRRGEGGGRGDVGGVGRGWRVDGGVGDAGRREEREEGEVMWEEWEEGGE